MSKKILLFDVDGTLTKSRQKIDQETMDVLRNLMKITTLGLVGGSDMVKIVEQMGSSKDQVISEFEYVFSENGLDSYRKGVKIESTTIQKQVGEEKLQKFINFCLKYLSEISLPVKRGTFIEFRKGMLNISPIGRSCSQPERDQFYQLDQKEHIRDKMVDRLRSEFPVEEYGLHFAIGGQISLDVFPVGWDKRFCLQYLIQDGFEEIHFFGDKVWPGGNDHEIYEDPRTIGHSVIDPSDTRRQLQEFLTQ